MAAASVAELAEPSVPGGSGEADALKGEVDALDALGQRGYFNERLDQLVVEVLLGAR
jgi:xylose isomerase